MESLNSSPCNSDCMIDQKTQLCRGCFRTMEEIISWFRLSNQEKQEILDQIKTRKKSLEVD